MDLAKITADHFLKPVAANDVPDKERPSDYYSIDSTVAVAAPMSDCSSQRSCVNVTIAGAVADVVVGAWRGRVAGGGDELLGIDAGCR